MSNSFLRWLRPKPIKTLVDEELYETERKFLEAVAAAEYWTSQSDMYNRRMARLRGYLRPAPATTPTGPLDRNGAPNE